MLGVKKWQKVYNPGPGWIRRNSGDITFAKC